MLTVSWNDRIYINHIIFSVRLLAHKQRLAGELIHVVHIVITHVEHEFAPSGPALRVLAVVSSLEQHCHSVAGSSPAVDTTHCRVVCSTLIQLVALCDIFTIAELVRSTWGLGPWGEELCMLQCGAACIPPFSLYDLLPSYLLLLTWYLHSLYHQLSARPSATFQLCMLVTRFQPQEQCKHFLKHSHASHWLCSDTDSNSSWTILCVFLLCVTCRWYRRTVVPPMARLTCSRGPQLTAPRVPVPEYYCLTCMVIWSNQLRNITFVNRLKYSNNKGPKTRSS